MSLARPRRESLPDRFFETLLLESLLIDPPRSRRKLVDPPRSRRKLVDPPRSRRKLVDPPRSRRKLVDPPRSRRKLNESDAALTSVAEPADDWRGLLL